jgi:hypothetical protein
MGAMLVDKLEVNDLIIIIILIIFLYYLYI